MQVPVIIGAVVIIALVKVNSAGSSTAAPATPPRAGVSTQAVAPTPKVPVEIVNWSWDNDHGMFLSLHDVRIKNNTSSDIKDVEIYCSASGESGTSIDRNSRTQYKVIKAGQTLDLGKVDMGFLHSQAYKVGCTVKNYSKA